MIFTHQDATLTHNEVTLTNQEVTLTHYDVLGFLTLTDALKLRLANLKTLEACTSMKWNDSITPVKDLITWKKSFPNSIALYFLPSKFKHERSDLIKYVMENPRCREILSDMHLKTLILPITKSNHFKNLWPLNTGSWCYLKELTLCIDNNVINCLPILISLEKFVCGEGSDINDADFLIVRDKFWQVFPALKEFDCTHTNLSSAILHGFDLFPSQLHLIHTNFRFFNETNINTTKFKILINQK